MCVCVCVCVCGAGGRGGGGVNLLAPLQMFNVKISEILMLVYRKIFSAFYPILHETFSILYKN